MANRKNLVFALLAAFLFSSCVIQESIGVTVIEISNKSPYDLHLSFEAADYRRFELDDVDIDKNQSCSVENIEDMTELAKDPNFSLKFVIFANRDDSGMSVEKPAEGLFIFKSREKYTEGGEKVVYSLTITDAMLLEP